MYQEVVGTLKTTLFTERTYRELRMNRCVRNLFKTAYKYTKTMGFSGKYTNLEHRGAYYYEVIFISKEAAALEKVQIRSCDGKLNFFSIHHNLKILAGAFFDSPFRLGLPLGGRE
jgi:hypothetical protein